MADLEDAAEELPFGRRVVVLLAVNALVLVIVVVLLAFVLVLSLVSALLAVLFRALVALCVRVRLHPHEHLYLVLGLVQLSHQRLVGDRLSIGGQLWGIRLHHHSRAPRHQQPHACKRMSQVIQHM
jgi:hypothetical protein